MALGGSDPRRTVQADVQYQELVVLNGVEWRPQAVQFEFESVEMERGGTGRRFDRLVLTQIPILTPWDILLHECWCA